MLSTSPETVTVPIEPTREMWAAMANAVVGKTSVHHDVVVEAVYRAMVASAPSSVLAQCPDQRVLDDMTLAHNVRKTTIEECARLCDGLRRKDYSMENADWVAGTLDCATAIRSLADTSTVCTTCNGRKIVGGFVNATSGYQDNPCPDCAPVSSPVETNGS